MYPFVTCTPGSSLDCVFYSIDLLVALLQWLYTIAPNVIRFLNSFLGYSGYLFFHIKSRLIQFR